MTHWQVRAETPSGGQILFGISGGNRKMALAWAVQVLAGTGAIIRELTGIRPLPPEPLPREILLLPERLAWRHTPAASQTGAGTFLLLWRSRLPHVIAARRRTGH